MGVSHLSRQLTSLLDKELTFTHTLPTSNLHDKIKTKEYSEWELLELKIIYLIVECLLH